MNDDLIVATSFEGRLGVISSLLQQGGPVVAILLVMSVIALAIILLKLWQFTILRPGSTQFVDKALGLWRAGRNSAAIEVLAPLRHPVAKTMKVAIKGCTQTGVSETMVREEATRVAAVELEKLRGNLRGLELIGSLSPLLGLLGTVLGMITAFQQLQAAGSRVDPSVLSGGIWEALLTTAVGLAVAIPAVAALSGLERIIERTRHCMEDALTQVFTIDITTAQTVIENEDASDAGKRPIPEGAVS